MWSLFCLSLLILHEWKDSLTSDCGSPPPGQNAKTEKAFQDENIQPCSMSLCKKLTTKWHWTAMVKPSCDSLFFFFSPHFKAWFVCKSWSRLHPDTASRSRSASCPQGAKTPGPYWKRWRRARSSTSSSTARTRRPPTSSSRWPTQTSREKKVCFCTKKKKKKKSAQKRRPVRNPIRFLFHRRIISFLALLSVSFSLDAGLVEFHPFRLNAARRINRRDDSNMSKLWYIPARITVYAYGTKWGHSVNGWNMQFASVPRWGHGRVAFNEKAGYLSALRWKQWP